MTARPRPGDCGRAIGRTKVLSRVVQVFERCLSSVVEVLTTVADTWAVTNRKAVPTLPPVAPLTPLALTDDVADAPVAANLDAAKAKTLFRTRKATAVAPRSTPSSTVKTGAAANDATAKPKRELFSIGKTVKPEVVMAFSRQLASFLEAGISVLEALEIVALETDSTPMKVVIADIRAAVQRGSSFVDAVAA
ncbi:MAG TPA: type II secretion system F family protein, partial [Ilumatobacteraceae bacterium]